MIFSFLFFYFLLGFFSFIYSQTQKKETPSMTLLAQPEKENEEHRAEFVCIADQFLAYLPFRKLFLRQI
jgi:hypothetical protein